MRYVEKIQTLWETGSSSFVGENRPSGRATVEKGFWLEQYMSNAGRKTRGPYRWFQRADDEELIQTEIPNILSIDIDREIDSDAATCRIVIQNTVSLLYGEQEEAEGVWGKPGYFSFSRGQSQEAKARWGQSSNEWADVFVPNALIRSWGGYGGHDKTIDEAVADGDIVQTGCWLVDSVEMSANGNLTLSCRDMMKLLIDQQLYPPLMPKKLYPLDYYRWVLTNQTIPKDELPTGVDPIGLPSHYGCTIGGSASSSTDAIYGYNAAILGHYPTDAFDSSPEPLGLTEPGSYAHQSTFWLSNGHSSATGSSSFEWIEVCCDGQDVNKMYIHPFGGDYECYISVWENGGWVAPEDSGQGGIIPYGGVDYTGVNAADIPYVTKVGVKWEAIDRQAEHVLPRVYKADKIRLTFTNLTRTDWEAPNNYRAGVRKMFPMYDRKAAIGGEHTRCFTCAPFPKVDSDAVGYWQVRQNGNVYAFGDARVYTPHASNPKTTHKYWVVASYGNHDGLGYWTMSMDGTVIGYGSAQHYGDASSTGETGFMGFAPTPTGNGYWLLHRDGYVYAYGDAVHEGDSTYSGTLPSGVAATAHAIESHPSLSGYWVLWTDGHVDALGSVTHYGNADRYLFTDTEYVACLRRTSTGSGYWIVSGSGWVKAYGDAPYRDSAEHYAHANWTDALIWDFLPNWNSDNGYALQRANGLLEVFGDFEIFGSVAEGVATLRSDGCYRDYSDIVKELAMWSGFLLYDTDSTPLEPEMFGIIETTGVYSKEPLPQEMFDKKPVIDAITELKQVCGYIVHCSQEGGFCFQSPNWWSLGNYDYDNEELDLIPVIDERVNLTAYGVSTADADLRSEIMISTEDPTVGFTDTVTTRIQPHGANLLRGMVKPGHWINGEFIDKKQQEVMADLISMHIWFGQRRGSVTCWANPLIDINDQVRIYERTTGETFVHYVRGVSTSFNATSGEYTMTLTTNWLGGSPFNNRPMFFACVAKPDGTGYWQARNDGQIWAFGTAELYSTDDTHRDWVVAMKTTQSGEGYYTLDVTGKIIAYGDAVHYGDLVSNDKNVLDMALTPSGEGYWMLKSTGEVIEFGDATVHGDDTPTGELPSGVDVTCHAIESHPSLDGFWILRTDGTVVDFGAVTHYGNADRTGFTGTEYVGTLRRTSTGSGYWIVSGSGKVQEFGDATYEGQPTPYSQNFWVDGLVWDFMPDYSGDGYIIQHSDGILDFYSSTVLGDARKHDYRIDTEWAITGGRGNSGGSTPGVTAPDDHFEISSTVIDFLNGTSSPSALKAVDAGFKVAEEPTGP